VTDSVRRVTLFAFVFTPLHRRDGITVGVTVFLAGYAGRGHVGPTRTACSDAGFREPIEDAGRA
jgi:hypothetical protein